MHGKQSVAVVCSRSNMIHDEYYVQMMHMWLYLKIKMEMKNFCAFF